MHRAKRGIVLLLAVLAGWLPGAYASTKSSPKKTAASSQTASASTKPAKVVARNGYRFELDALNRVIKVEGSLTLDKSQPRNQKAQLEAGGASRRDDDDGGHYIGRRFKGPTDAFNHFAHNRNFNRGKYRALEDDWESSLRARKKVRLQITTVFVGRSLRPAKLAVKWWIDGKPAQFDFDNEPGGGTQ
jgi:hypothetical protein